MPFTDFEKLSKSITRFCLLGKNLEHRFPEKVIERADRILKSLKKRRKQNVKSS